MGCDILKLPSTSSLDVSNMVNVDVNLPRDVSLNDFNKQSANPGLSTDMKNISDLVQTKSTATNPLSEQLGPTAMLDQTTSGINNIGDELTRTIEDCFKSATSLKDKLKDLLNKDIQIPDLQAILQKELEQMLKNFPNSPEAIIAMIRKSVSLVIDIPGISGLNGAQKCINDYLNEAAGMIADIRDLACGSVNKLTPRAKLDMIKSPATTNKNLGTINDSIKIQIGDAVKSGNSVPTTPPVMDLPGLSTPPIVPAGTVEPAQPKTPPTKKATQTAQDSIQTETLNTEKTAITSCNKFVFEWAQAANRHVSDVIKYMFDNHWPGVFIEHDVQNPKNVQAYNLLRTVGDQHVVRLVARWFFTTHWNAGSCEDKSPGITTDMVIKGSGNEQWKTPDMTLQQVLAGKHKWGDFSSTNTTSMQIPSVGALPITHNNWQLVIDELFTPKHWSTINIRNMSSINTTQTTIWQDDVFSNHADMTTAQLTESLEKFHDAVDSSQTKHIIKTYKQDELSKLQSTGFTQMAEQVQSIVDMDNKILGVYKNSGDLSVPRDVIYYVSTFDWNSKQITQVELLPGSSGEYLDW